MKLLFFCVALLFIIPTSVFAYEISFPSNEFRFVNTPTYCIVYPTNNDLSDEKRNLLVSTAHDAVKTWKDKLQSSETEDITKWDIKSKTVLENDPKECDFSIYFENSLTNQDIIIESEIYEFKKIVIPYVDISQSNILNVLLHRIGHSIGLGHYVSDDDEINKSWYSKFESPSIMIPILYDDPKIMKITDEDVTRVKEIYSQAGFSKENQGATDFVDNKISIPIDTIGKFRVGPREIYLTSSHPVQFVGIYGHVNKNVNATNSTTDTPSVTPSGMPCKASYMYNSCTPQVVITITYPKSPDKKEQYDTDKKPFNVHTLRPTENHNFEVTLFIDKKYRPGDYSIEASYRGYISKPITLKLYGLDEKQPPVRYVCTQLIKPTSEDDPENFRIPAHIRNLGKCWLNEQTSEINFINLIPDMIKYYYKKDNIHKTSNDSLKKVPIWIKANVNWWVEYDISEQEFVDALRYLKKIGSIKV